MRQQKRVWNLLCLLIALSVFGAVMTETRLNHFSLIKPVMGTHQRVLTDVKRRPDLAFFWMLSQKASQPQSGFSDEQKARIHEEFRRLFVQVIAAEHNALSETSGTAFPTSSKLGRILAEHRLAIRNIFTPEQRRKHRARKTAGKLTGKLQTAAEFPRSAVSGIKLVHMSSHSVRPLSDFLPQSSSMCFAHTHSSELAERDVYQLQILRL